MPARTSDDFTVARSQFRGDKREPLKFDGQGGIRLENFLLVGALLNDDGTLTRNDEAFLFAFMRTCIELGFSIPKDHVINICTLPNDDFLALDETSADAVLFCNLFHDDFTREIPAIEDEDEPIVFRSPHCLEPKIWAKSLEKTNAIIAGNINGEATLPTEKLVETSAFEKVKLSKRVDINFYDLDVVGKPSLKKLG